MKVRPPCNNVDLQKLAGSGGLGLKDLENVLEAELSEKRRTYVVLRIAMRINKLRGRAFIDEVIRRLANG